MGDLVGALRAMLSLDSTQFVKGANRAAKASDNLQGNLDRVRGAMKKISIGLAAAGAAFAYAMKGQLDYVDQLGDMSEKLGIGVKELSRLAYAAKATGVPLETLEKALGQLSKGMLDAKDGAGPAADLFKELGISVTDSAGNLRDTEAVLQDLSDRLAAMPDGAEKTATAMRLFGKSGAEMLLMLNNGGDGLRKLTEEAKAMGLEITEEQAAAAGKFSANIDKLKTLASGLGTKLAAALAPALESITNWLIEFVTVDLPQFLADAQKFFADIGSSLSGVATAVQESFGKVGQWMSETWTGIRSSIGGAITYVTDLWDTFVGKVLAAVDTIKEAGKAIAEALSVDPEVGAGFAGRFGGLGASAGAAISGEMSGAGASGADGLVEGFKNQVVKRQGEIDEIADGITSRVRNRWQIQSPSRVFREIGQFLSEGLGQGIRDGQPQVESAMDTVGDAIDGKADSLTSKLESFKSTVQGAFVGLVTGANSLKQAIGQVASQLAQMAAQAAFQQLFGGAFKEGGFLGKLFGGLFANGAAFANGRVTAFAMQGGMGVMGEAGPEAIMPLARGRGGKLGVLAQGGAQRVQIEITENPMFASRVEGISDQRAVQVTRTYDRNVAPQTRNRNPRERG